jgi:DNA helicase II / ATP-dependent DNA helicase PcrA
MGYLAAFQPQVLRWSSTAGTNYLPSSVSCYTFGSSKGLGFDRVLIVPTKKHMKFFCGDDKAFKKEKTEESQNKLYVAITRARFSLAILVEDKLAKNLPYAVWDGAGTLATANKM